MASLDLARDPRSGYYTIPVAVLRRPGHQGSQSGDSPYANVEFLLDTGATNTTISDEVAVDLGYALEALEKESVVGVGGFTEEPVIRDVTVWILSSGDPTQLRLPKVFVMGEMSYKVRKAHGRYVRRKGRPPIQDGTVHRPGFCLFGLDALEALGATVTLAVRERRGRLDW